MDIFEIDFITKMVDYHLKRAEKFLNSGQMKLYEYHMHEAQKLIDQVDEFFKPNPLKWITNIRRNA